MKDIIGQRLRHERDSRKLTREEVAKAIGCLSWQAIYNIERGHRFPSLMTAKRLCDFYGISMDLIFVPAHD